MDGSIAKRFKRCEYKIEATLDLHGKTENAIASIIIDEDIEKYDFTEIEAQVNEYELITSEEVEEIFRRKGE